MVGAYSRIERRRGKFVIHTHVDVKPSIIDKLKAWVKFKFKHEPKKKTMFVITNKDNTKFNLVDSMGEAKGFNFDDAVKTSRNIPIKGLQVSLAKWTGKQWVTV